MLHVADILTELDVLAVDSMVLSTFGASPAIVSSNLSGKRNLVVRQWLHARLLKHGYDPARHSVRRVPTAAYGYTDAAFSADLSETLGDKTLDDVNISSIVNSPGLSFLYVASDEPMRGLWAGMLDSVNTNSLTVNSLTYWNGGQWAGFTSLVDGTVRANSIAWSGGGYLDWQLPPDWTKRSLNAEEDWRYWLRIGLNQPVATTTKVTQLLPIRTSRLTYPATLKALSLLYLEGWGVQGSEWREKGERYDKDATEALTSALGDLEDEFTVGTQEAVTATDVNTVTRDPDFFTLERG